MDPTRPKCNIGVQRLKWWYSLTHIYIYVYMYGNRVNQTMPTDLLHKGEPVRQWPSLSLLPTPPPPPLNPSQILSSAPQLLPAFRVPRGGTTATNFTCALSFCLGPWGTLQQWNRTVDLIILKALSSPLGLGYPKRYYFNYNILTQMLNIGFMYTMSCMILFLIWSIISEQEGS